MRAWIFALAILGGAASVLALVQTGIKVTLDGKVMSSKGFIKDGTLFVPASDVAKALGKAYSFDKATNTAKIEGAGGANQADGSEGKAGDTLFNGLTRVVVAKEFAPGDPYTTLAMEFRNAEKAVKTYKFGFTATRYTLFDAAGVALEGEQKDNSNYAVDLAQGEPRKIVVSYKFPAGYNPVRLVIRLETQISGNPQKTEVFRVNF